MCVVPIGPYVVSPRVFSCIESVRLGALESIVVVSVEVDDPGFATTTGGLACVSCVTVLLVTVGSAGTVVTVVLDSEVASWHHAFPASHTAATTAALQTHKLKDCISFTSCFLSEYEGSRGRSPDWATTVLDSVYSVSFHAALTAMLWKRWLGCYVPRGTFGPDINIPVTIKAVPAMANACHNGSH